MAVFIDIPGIGNIEAKNAASEATLREILKAMKGVQKNTAGGGGGGGGASAGGGSGAAGASNMLSSMGKGAGTAAKALGKMAGAVGVAVGAIVSLSEGAVKTIKAIADVGDSVESAANVFSSLPILGTLFGAVAAASQKVNDSYLAAASGGASFAGSMQQFSASATAAGMTMEKYGQFVSQNGAAMLGLGTTVEEGAKRFSQVSKGLRAVSGDLYALGFSTQEINQGLANYTRNLRITGRQGSQSNAELVAGSKKYLKEMDMLAKITGETRAEKEKEREQLLLDGQFAAASAGLNKDVSDSMANLIQSLPSKELQNLAKDVLATGSVTRSENQALAAQMPGLVSQLQGMHQQTQANVQIGKAQANQTLNSTKTEAAASLLRGKAAFASSEELSGVSTALASAARINTDATKTATAEQDKAAKNTDGMNQQMQKAQAELAAISNEFTMYLANSGILQVMLDAFKGLVGFVRTYVVPAFNFLTTAVQTVWGFLTGSLGPAFVVLEAFIVGVGKTIFEFGKFIWNATAPLRELASVIYQRLWPAFVAASDFVEDVFRKVGDVVQDYLRPVFDMLGRVINSVTSFIKDDFEKVLTDVSNFLDTKFIEPFRKVASFFQEKFGPQIQFVVDVFNDVKNAIATWFAKWNSFQDIVDSIKLRFQGLQISLQKLMLWIDEKTTFFKNPEEKAEFEKRRKELADSEQANADARAALEKKLQDQAAVNLAASAAKQAAVDRERELRDQKITYDRSQRDKKIAEMQSNTNRTLYNGAKEATAALKENSGQTTNYNDSVALAGIEYTRNNAPVTAQADNTRTAMANEATQRAAAAAQNSTTGSGNTSPASGQRPPTTQESSESLLASLNTKMDQLIRTQLAANDLHARQLTVQQSMTGDLFVAT